MKIFVHSTFKEQLQRAIWIYQHNNSEEIYVIFSNIIFKN